GTIRRVMLEYLSLLKIYDFYQTNGRKHKHHTKIRQFRQ
ncbi:hypothetical protein Goshw_009061, partial [Gossypium schwendimanii]|nr:hypothetical protein [Gossypium schwendimanii]